MIDYNETFYDNLYQLGKDTWDENGHHRVIDIGFIDYMKELNFIPEDDIVLSVGVVWYYDGDDVEISHIYDNTREPQDDVNVIVDFNNIESSSWTEEQEALFNSIIMYGDVSINDGWGWM